MFRGSQSPKFPGIPYAYAMESIAVSVAQSTQTMTKQNITEKECKNTKNSIHPAIAKGTKPSKNSLNFGTQTIRTTDKNKPYFYGLFEDYCDNCGANMSVEIVSRKGLEDLVSKKNWLCAQCLCLCIKMLTGQIDAILINKLDTVKELKEKYEKQTGVPADQIRFFYRGRLWRDECTLKDYGVTERCTIHMAMRCG